jgi:hypothetical protein
VSLTRTPTTSASPRSRARLRRLPRPGGDTLFWLFILAVATALMAARQPGFPSWVTIWQEDGAIFYSDAWNEATLPTIFEPYNSYLHVVPRIVAAVVALFPLKLAAVGLTFGAALIVAALGIYVYHASGSVFRSPWARGAMAVAIVLLPAGGYETGANISNLHWYLDYALFWAFVANPKTRRGVAVGALITAAAVLSDPLVALFLPLVLRRALENRGERIGLVLPGVFAACLALQLVVGVFQEQTGRNASSSWGDLPGVYALRVAGSTLVGDTFLGRFWLTFGYAFAYAALAIVVGLLVYGFLKSDRPRRWFIAESALYSVLTLCVTLMLRGTENFLDRDFYSLNGSRYTVLPIMFLIGALIAVFDSPEPRLSPLTWRRIQAAAVVLLAALVLTSFSQHAVRSGGPRWSAQITWAKDECAKRARGENADPLWNLPRAPGEPPTPMELVRIPISPYIPLGGGRADVPFAVAIPCEDVLR